MGIKKTEGVPPFLSNSDLEDLSGKWEHDLIRWRTGIFKDQGFTQEESEKLAKTKDDIGFFYSYHKIEKMLSEGCSKDLILKIVL